MCVCSLSPFVVFFRSLKANLLCKQVAHTEDEKNASITLDSLYIESLLTMLNAQNPGGVKAGVRPKFDLVSCTKI